MKELNLFSKRFKELIVVGQGNPTDNITQCIKHDTKMELSKVLLDFAEPLEVKNNRYDDEVEKTDAFEMARNKLNEIVGYPITDFLGSEPLQVIANLFTPYLFDLIELQFDELSNSEKVDFERKINLIFKNQRALFRLSEDGVIIQNVDYEVLDNGIEKSVNEINEVGLKELLNEAISLHKKSDYSAHKDAVEKIWDALERLKTYHTELDKKNSLDRIMKDMACQQDEFYNLFDEEFRALTTIGNKFRIRHHETDKKEIIEQHHYDYLFDRCLSLIALSIQYLQKEL